MYQPVRKEVLKVEAADQLEMNSLILPHNSLRVRVNLMYECLQTLN